MKVDIVELVENEMVDLNVAEIGSNWGWREVGDEYDSDYGDDYGDVECGDACGDDYAKIINITIFFHLPLHPILHPILNRPNPLVLAPYLSLL